MIELIELLGEQTLIVTDKGTIDKLFDSLPKGGATAYAEVSAPPNLPNSRAITRGTKEVFFVDITEVDINVL